MGEKKNRLGLNLFIDENNLLAEWQSQASLMLEYGIRYADALQEEDEARARVSVTQAKLDKKIRDDPEAYGVGKTTEASILNAVQAHPDYIEAQETLNAARCDARVFQAAVTALAHRKSALQGMTDLYLRQWFADPKMREQAEGEAGTQQRTKGVLTPSAPPVGRRVRKHDDETNDDND